MKLRPHYKFELQNVHSEKASMDIFIKAKETSPDLEIIKTKKILQFYIPKKERKLWTPYLAVSFEDTEKGVIVRGNIGPEEKIWVPFIFLYAVLIFLICAVLIYGFVHLSLGYSGEILWLIIPMVLSLSGLYLFSYLGQRKSSHCVLVFHNLLHRTFIYHSASMIYELK